MTYYDIYKIENGTNVGKVATMTSFRGAMDYMHIMRKGVENVKFYYKSRHIASKFDGYKGKKFYRYVVDEDNCNY